MTTLVIILEIAILVLLVYFMWWSVDMWGRTGQTFNEIEYTFYKINHEFDEIENKFHEMNSMFCDIENIMTDINDLLQNGRN